MILKKGSTGTEVIKWQQFLAKQGYKIGALDGIFGSKTEEYTKHWQAKNGLTADGKVGNNTLTKAGFNTAEVAQSSYYPPKPNFSTPSQSAVRQMFGTFAYKNLGGGRIQITDGWQAQNITKILIPQLIGVPYAPADGQIYFHKLVANQLKSAFQEVEDKGLKNRIISWSGSFYPRMVRGSSRTLSNHSWGTAFDINAPENWLGQRPAKLGQKGCLLELVPIFNKWGFFWGGHYNNRLDGMHFEAAKIL